MTTRRILLSCLALVCSLGAEAQTLVIKLAMVAPKDSVWYEYLQEIDQLVTSATLLDLGHQGHTMETRRRQPAHHLV